MPFPNANFQKLLPVALTGANGHRLGWKSFIDHMLANGFSHVESGDGIAAFSTVTLQITNSGLGANGVNPGAHVILRDGDGEDIQLTFVTEAGAGSGHGYDVSPAAGFTGGTATVKGSATDQGTISNGTQNGAITFATTNCVAYGYCENVSPFRFFYAIAFDHAAGVSNFDRTKPDHGFFRDTFGAHSFPEDSHPNHYVYGYGAGSGAFADAGGAPWQVHAYKDASAPATTANFEALRHESGTFIPNPQQAGLPYDFGGRTAKALKFQFDLVTRRALPSLTSLMFKGQLDPSIGCRTHEADTSIGGTLDTAGDAVSIGNLFHPWSPPTPRINLADDFTAASGIAANRLYHEQGAFGGGSAAGVIPVLSLLTPADLASITRLQEISFQLDSSGGIDVALVILKYVGEDHTETVYDSQAFLTPYDESGVVDTFADQTRLEFTLKPRTNLFGRKGWRKTIERLAVVAADGTVLEIS